MQMWSLQILILLLAVRAVKLETFTPPHPLRNGKIQPVADRRVMDDDVDPFANYEYEEETFKAITPMVKKYRDPSKLFLRKLKNPPTTEANLKANMINLKQFLRDAILNDVRPKGKSEVQLRANTKEKKGHPHIVADQEEPVDIFYRKSSGLKYNINNLHCQHLITPFVTGMKDHKHLSLIMAKDHVVDRFIQLLNVNLTGYSTEEVYGVLNQINKLTLKFYLWEENAILRLMNLLISGTDHSFWALKRGLQKRFDYWNLDISNTAVLLKKTKILRPPCLNQGGTAQGFTKHTTRMTYTPKPDKTTKSCNKSINVFNGFS